MCSETTSCNTLSIKVFYHGTWYMKKKEIWFGGREQYVHHAVIHQECFNCMKGGWGRKTACVKNAIQIGLLQTYIGNEGLKTIILSENVPPCSLNKRNAEKFQYCLPKNVMYQYEKHAEHRIGVKEFNSRIRNKTGIIDIQCDSTYNNSIYRLRQCSMCSFVHSPYFYNVLCFDLLSVSLKLNDQY